jgi:prepilin-type N-terminal cleavage/methylation domain-containing protein
MARRHARTRGFTVVELVLVVSIVAVLAALAYVSFGRLRPRARLADATNELVAIVHGARQHALATGHDVVVMVFPQFAGPDSTGRVVVYEDGDFALLNSAATPNFGGYDPASPQAGPRSEVLVTYDLPRSVVVGPTAGAGAGSTMPAPLAGIAIDVDCSFCATTGDRRGAIRFDPRGRATFYSANGVPLANQVGGTLSLAAPETDGQRTLVVTSGTGSVGLRAQGG